jgi:peptide/nickel transport system substrate-binding protein
MMTKKTRRDFLQAGAGVGALAAMPAIVRGQGTPSTRRTLNVVMGQGLNSFDPVLSTSTPTSYHSYAIYDTLFGLDTNMTPQPQMLSKWGVSDDKKTYTFELRDGLRFSDGSPVTPADCVASIRRWGGRDASGKELFSRLSDTPVKDSKTFQIVLKEPYGMVIDMMSKASTSCLFMMRKKEADTDPNQPITEYIGSGPFTFNRTLTRNGATYVYDRNPNYVPRREAASGLAGGKVAKVDRVVWQQIADARTAMAALQNGEIDFYEVPTIDLLGDYEQDPKIKIEVLNKFGWVGMVRPNHLHPPFDNVKARQALKYLLNPVDMLHAFVGSPKYERYCGAYFGCGGPMENDANLEWYKNGRGQNIAKAAQLFKEAGYDGRPVVVMQPTDILALNVGTALMVQWLRQAGINVDLATTEWGAIAVRRGNKNPPDRGGWNLLNTNTSGYQLGANPFFYWGHAASGDNAGFGWPTNPEHEKLRAAWAAAGTLAERKAIAVKMQAEAWEWVPYVTYGQWLAPTAYRTNTKGWIGMPEVIPLWNIEKT